MRECYPSGNIKIPVPVCVHIKVTEAYWHRRVIFSGSGLLRTEQREGKWAAGTEWDREKTRAMHLRCRKNYRAPGRTEGWKEGWKYEKSAKNFRNCESFATFRSSCNVEVIPSFDVISSLIVKKGSATSMWEPNFFLPLFQFPVAKITAGKLFTRGCAAMAQCKTISITRKKGSRD